MLVSHRGRRASPLGTAVVGLVILALVVAACGGLGGVTSGTKPVISPGVAAVRDAPTFTLGEPVTVVIDVTNSDNAPELHEEAFAVIRDVVGIVARDKGHLQVITFSGAAASSQPVIPVGLQGVPTTGTNLQQLSAAQARATTWMKLVGLALGVNASTGKARRGALGAAPVTPGSAVIASIASLCAPPTKTCLVLSDGEDIGPSEQYADSLTYALESEGVDGVVDELAATDGIPALTGQTVYVLGVGRDADPAHASDERARLLSSFFETYLRRAGASPIVRTSISLPPPHPQPRSADAAEVISYGSNAGRSRRLGRSRTSRRRARGPRGSLLERFRSWRTSRKRLDHPYDGAEAPPLPESGPVRVHVHKVRRNINAIHGSSTAARNSLLGHARAVHRTIISEVDKAYTLIRHEWQAAKDAVEHRTYYTNHHPESLHHPTPKWLKWAKIALIFFEAIGLLLAAQLFGNPIGVGHDMFTRIAGGFLALLMPLGVATAMVILGGLAADAVLRIAKHDVIRFDPLVRRGGRHPLIRLKLVLFVSLVFMFLVVLAAAILRERVAAIVTAGAAGVPTWVFLCWAGSGALVSLLLSCMFVNLIADRQARLDAKTHALHGEGDGQIGRVGAAETAHAGLLGSANQVMVDGRNEAADEILDGARWYSEFVVTNSHYPNGPQPFTQTAYHDLLDRFEVANASVEHESVVPLLLATRQHGLTQVEHGRWPNTERLDRIVHQTAVDWTPALSPPPDEEDDSFSIRTSQSDSQNASEDEPEVVEAEIVEDDENDDPTIAAYW